MVYDWIVIGNGITGAAVSYELARLGLTVLLVERDESSGSATRHSYGGIAYWSGSTPLMQQLCRDGIERHRSLSNELDYDTQLRELDLLLTIPRDLDPDTVALSYQACDIPPQLISREQAVAMEPLLNPDAIAAALTVKHGHVDPEATVRAYNHGFLKAKGTLRYAEVTGFLQNVSSQGVQRVSGIATVTEQFQGQNVLICTGGWTRHFLQAAGIPFHQCFTHAESIELLSPNNEADRIRLNTIVMPANLQRFQLEGQGGDRSRHQEWENSNQELVPPILDAGALQFANGQIRMGQISRVLTDPFAPIDAQRSEQDIRTQVGHVLPGLQNQPGQWCHTLVAFTGDRLPLIGPIQNIEGLHVFSGFGNPFALVPALAQRFAQQVTTPTGSDPILEQMLPNRIQ